MDSKFELGVSRTAGLPTSPSTQERKVPEEETADYVRPALEKETKPWSLDETSDMLF